MANTKATQQSATKSQKAASKGDNQPKRKKKLLDDPPIRVKGGSVEVEFANAFAQDMSETTKKKFRHGTATRKIQAIVLTGKFNGKPRDTLVFVVDDPICQIDVSIR